MINNNFVSVIIPTFNRADLITRAVRSVLNQTHSNLECLIIDDCSTDNTKEILSHISDKRLIYVRHDRNKNASASRNTGIKLARGEYIAFQDSDDEWLPEKLEKQVNLLNSLPESYGMVYCWQDYYENDQLVKEHHKSFKGKLYPLILTRIMTGGAQTLLIRKKVLEKTGGFDVRVISGDDQDLIRRIAKDFMIDVIPEALVKVFIDHSSETRLSDYKVRKNIEECINSRIIELDKFKETFMKRPDLKASVFSDMAYHYALLNDRKNFYNFCIKAWVYWPFRGRIKSTQRALRKIYEQSHT